MHGLWRGDRCIRVAHRCGRNPPTKQHKIRLYAKECRVPQDEIGAFANFHRSDLTRHAMGDCRIDRIFCHITASTIIIITRCVLGKGATLPFHLVGSLPATDNHFTDTPHRLTVGRDDRESAHVMQNIFRGDCFFTDTTFSKGDVFGNGRRQVVADHQHVEMFSHGVYRIRPRRIGRSGQHVRILADTDDIWCVPATCAFCVE